MFREGFSTRDLIVVFKLCDPSGSGRVSVEHLKDLARIYTENDAERLGTFFRQLDRHGRESLSFKEFSTAIRTIFLRQKDVQDASFKESMMSPITTATDTSLSNGNDFQYVVNLAESPRTNNEQKSQCSSLSDCDIYECSTENGDIDDDQGIVADRNGTDGRSLRSPPNLSINRNTWLRTSLRRSPQSHQDNLPNRRWGSFRQSGKRQLGSNSLTNQLYRSSSFNSSGRSSNSDIVDDMYSDASLEEDVLHLNHKMQLLQQQVGVLQDSSNNNDDRYTRAKADNAALQARVIMLEEQLRDAELRHEERLQDEHKRSKELLARVEREKQLQLENYSIRLKAAETESGSLREEVQRQRVRLEKLENERQQFLEQIDDLKNELAYTKEEEGKLKEKEKRLTVEQEAHSQLIEELSKEVERLRSEARTPALPTTSPETIRLEELHEEMAALRARNVQLEEANEELQANLLHAGIEQGRLLTAGENNLAAELDAMSQDETDIIPYDSESVGKMQHALKEQQDVIAQLKTYIDSILLNIVENYPQLLEVKQRAA